MVVEYWACNDGPLFVISRSEWGNARAFPHSVLLTFNLKIFG